MLRLHGLSISNYYNMVKHTLMEKGLSFDEVMVRPNQDPDYLALSPMGKVPCLECPEGVISETSAILEFIERAHPTPAMLPSGNFARAKAAEIMRVAELYVELPARRHLSEVMFGGDRNEAAHAEVRPIVERGLRALDQLCEFSPLLNGESVGQADIYLFHVFDLARQLLLASYDWDIVTDVAGLDNHIAAVAALPSSQSIQADQHKLLQELFGKS